VRFAQHGLDGLNDAPRPGKPRSFSPSATNARRGTRL
jgi:hypothetical protein